jgi:hypothetical protein
MLDALLRELRAYPGDPAPAGNHAPSVAAEDIAVPLKLCTQGGVLSFLSTITVFGTAVEITLGIVAGGVLSRRSGDRGGAQRASDPQGPVERVSYSQLDMKPGLVFAPRRKGGGDHWQGREGAGSDDAEPPVAAVRIASSSPGPPQRRRCTAGLDEGPAAALSISDHGYRPYGRPDGSSGLISANGDHPRALRRCSILNAMKAPTSLGSSPACPRAPVARGSSCRTSTPASATNKGRAVRQRGSS